MNVSAKEFDAKAFEEKLEQAKSQLAREKIIKTIEKWLRDEAKGKFKLTDSEIVALMDVQKLIWLFVPHNKKDE